MKWEGDDRELVVEAFPFKWYDTGRWSLNNGIRSLFQCFTTPIEKADPLNRRWLLNWSTQVWIRGE